MEERRILELQKILYPEEYKTTYVYTYPMFNTELKELIERSGYITEFKIKYHKGLRFLEHLKKKCVMNPNLFEELRNTGGLYSMKLKGEKNIRILFSFVELEGREVIILLNCFHEKKTKDYSEPITEAEARRKELFGV